MNSSNYEVLFECCSIFSTFCLSESISLKLWALGTKFVSCFLKAMGRNRLLFLQARKSWAQMLMRNFTQGQFQQCLGAQGKCTNKLHLVQKLSFSFTNRIVPNSTSALNWKLCPTFILYALCCAPENQSTGTKAAHKYW